MLTITSNNTTFIYKPLNLNENVKLIKFCIDYLDENEFLSFFNMN